MLHLVRHGRTDANAQGLLLGRADPHLSEEGRHQAAALAAIVPAGARVVSSPLRRTRETAEAFGVPIEIDDRWIELDYGELDGTPLRDVPPDLWRQWRADPDVRAGRRRVAHRRSAAVPRRARSSDERSPRPRRRRGEPRVADQGRPSPGRSARATSCRGDCSCTWPRSRVSASTSGAPRSAASTSSRPRRDGARVQLNAGTTSAASRRRWSRSCRSSTWKYTVSAPPSR